MRLVARLAGFAAAVLLAGCELAPAYVVPPIDLAARFKESPPKAEQLKEDKVWRLARPSDRLPRGAWWTTFDDRTLDGLEPRVDIANQTLTEAFSTYQQARASVKRAEAALFPTLDSTNYLTGNRQSDHRPLRSANQPDYYGANQLGLQSTYEVDLWGRVRDTIAAAGAEAESRGDFIESVKLSLQAELARDYVALRGLDRELAVLRDSQRAYQDALTLTKNRLTGQIASPIDVARAESQLDTAKALIEDTTARRATLEHAIATLVGEPASSFTIPVAPISLTVPRGPSAAPSTLLERRPDIAAAERSVAAANEGIGIARAAFYPRLFLNLSAGTQDTGLHLLDLNNAFFAIGPSVTIPIFDGGLRRADLAAATARRDGEAAHYRATVLRAVQEVEDALAQGRHLALASRRLQASVDAQKKVLDLSLTLYRDGATSYLDVVIAQNTLLDQQRALLALLTRRLTASVDLFVALGGGWNAEVADLSPAAPPLVVLPH